MFIEFEDNNWWCIGPNVRVRICSFRIQTATGMILFLCNLIMSYLWCWTLSWQPSCWAGAALTHLLPCRCRSIVSFALPSNFTLCYWPQRSCGQGNIFTPVCHSFCSQGGVCLSACPPVSRHPPGSRHPTNPHGSRPPTPWEQTPPHHQVHPLGSGTPPWD